jgi:hypothetical protein
VRDYGGLRGFGLMIACFRVMYGLVRYSMVIGTPEVSMARPTERLIRRTFPTLEII